MTAPRIVIYAGNVFDGGMQAYGPFASSAEATQWADAHLSDPEWFWSHLTDPADIEPRCAGREPDYGAPSASERAESAYWSQRDVR